MKRREWFRLIFSAFAGLFGSKIKLPAKPKSEDIVLKPPVGGTLEGWVSYKYHYVAVMLDGPKSIGGNYKYNVLPCETEIGI